MMTRHRLIRFLSGRDADFLVGVIAELRPVGRKAPLRRRISNLLAASEGKNPGARKPSAQNLSSPLDGKTAPEAIISFI
jgi:hypothetical protein